MGKKTTLPSLRNIEWRTVKMEMEKMNQLLTYISTKTFELNEFIYAGAKLDGAKLGGPLKSVNKTSKRGWEICLETQI